MIWFGNLGHLLPSAGPDPRLPIPEGARMRAALERVAERAPHLTGAALLDALAATGCVDRGTAARLFPQFKHFDADRHFADYLRRLSFRGASVLEEFRLGIRYVFQEVTGTVAHDEAGAEDPIRIRAGSFEGVVLAYPEVAFSIGGRVSSSIEAAVEQMPDALIVVARNFDPHAAGQLSTMLVNTGIRGTLVTVNLLLGIRAIAIRYQPSLDQVVATLGTGRPLRSADVARLGDRV
jgi:hypothetical protein